MNPDLEITVHFLRAFYYYSSGNSIWHIHFKKIKNFAEDFHFRKMMNDFAAVENFDPFANTNIYCDPYVGGIGAAYRELAGGASPLPSSRG
jgi:hypothetical protein